MTPELSLPPIESLRSLQTAEQLHTLDLLFEPSSELHGLILPLIQERSFASYSNLVDECGKKIAVLAQDSSQTAKSGLRGILESHPRLGAAKISSAQSVTEQARLTNLEARAQLEILNAQYEGTFGGLRYVAFVNGRGAPEILEDMTTRIQRADVAQEERDTIEAMCAIARDRASKLETLKD